MAEDGAKPLKKSSFGFELPAEARRLPAHAHLALRVRQLEESFAGHRELEVETRRFVEEAVRRMGGYSSPRSAAGMNNARLTIDKFKHTIDDLYRGAVRHLERGAAGRRSGHVGSVEPGKESDRSGEREGGDRTVERLLGQLMAPEVDPAEEQRFILARLRAHLEQHTGVVDKFLDEVEGLVKEFRPREAATAASDTSSQPLLGTKQAAELIGVTQNAIQKAAQTGKIGTEVSGRYLFSVSELEEYRRRVNPKGGRPKKERTES